MDRAERASWRGRKLVMPRVAAVAAAVAVAVSALTPAGPAGAGAADDYEPGTCIDNAGVGPHPFADVPAGAFFAKAVQWAFANGVTEGTAASTFGPNGPVTRGQFATMLHRSVCLPTPSGDADFTDLRPGAFYLDAVDWLVGEELTTGVAPGLFGPERTLTRGEFATFLHRMVGTPGGAPPAGFADVEPGRFYGRAVDWLLYRGVTAGTSPSTFSPHSPITRGEVVTFLHRLNTIGDVRAHFETVLSGLSFPVAAVQNPATGTWFIAEKGGTVVRWSGGGAEDLLTIAVSGGNEQGLLGLAIPDDGSHIYLSSTNPDGHSRITEFDLDGDDIVSTPRELLTQAAYDQPASNHNGGHIVFGPDGLLYFGLGDGGGSNDPDDNGQDTSTMLGSILRIDPANPDTGKGYGVPAGNPFVGVPGNDEIWLHGVRNPWRFSFDRVTGDLWVGDVGQNAREEITRLPAPEAGRGANLGWRLREGTIATPGVGGPPPPGHVEPVHDYSLPGAQSITGGYVYRGRDIPALEGVYLWADFIEGTLRGWRDTVGVESEEITTVGGRPTSFAEDRLGEFYVLTRGGELRKLVRG